VTKLLDPFVKRLIAPAAAKTSETRACSALFFLLLLTSCATNFIPTAAAEATATSSSAIKPTQSSRRNLSRCFAIEAGEVDPMKEAEV